MKAHSCSGKATLNIVTVLNINYLTMQSNRIRLARLSEEESLDGDPDNFRDFVTFDFVTLSTFVLEGSQSL